LKPLSFPNIPEEWGFSLETDDKAQITMEEVKPELLKKKIIAKSFRRIKRGKK
jgi:hypothetical protein